MHKNALARMPSLLALRAFAGAAEHLSFTRAAEALHVTQAAVSRHVRVLELELGQALFRRLHRRVELTPAGQRLAQALESGFRQIEAAVRFARYDHRQPLRVTVEPAFAARWLVPRLSAFARLHPEIALDLDTSNVLRRLREEADVAIRHVAPARARPPGRARRLFTCDVVPVVAWALRPRGRVKRDVDVLKFRLIHEDDGRAWAQWLQAAALSSAEAGVVHQRFSDYSVAIDAAQGGAGVVLGAVPFVRADLAAHRLAQVGRTSLPGGAYWVLESTERGSAQARAAFVEWLIAQLSAESVIG